MEDWKEKKVIVRKGYRWYADRFVVSKQYGGCWLFGEGKSAGCRG